MELETPGSGVLDEFSLFSTGDRRGGLGSSGLDGQVRGVIGVVFGVVIGVVVESHQWSSGE